VINKLLEDAISTAKVMQCWWYW